MTPQRFLVPALLPMTMKRINTKDREAVSSVSLSASAANRVNPYTGYESKTAFVCTYLRDFKRDAAVSTEDLQLRSFVPEGLFTLVLAHVVSHAQHSATQTPRLSRTHAQLFMETTMLELELVPQAGGIKIRVKSAQPRAMLMQVYTTVQEAVAEHFADLSTHLLVPHSKETLLFFDDVLHHHREVKAMWVGTDLLEHAAIEERYGPLLPRLGLQDQYDVFLSYRQTANSGFVMNLHPVLEQQNLVAFLDANNLETGLDFKLSFMEAIGRSLVACPVVSAGALERMRELAHRDFCDNVLLEWSTMLALSEHVRQAGVLEGEVAQLVRLQRVIPLFLGPQWLNANTMTLGGGGGGGDNADGGGGKKGEQGNSFGSMRAIAEALPDRVSIQTYADLCRFFEQVLRLPHPAKRTVRETVLALFNIDAVVEFNTGDMLADEKTQQLRSHAETIRKIVVAAREKQSAAQGTATATATSMTPAVTSTRPASISVSFALFSLSFALHQCPWLCFLCGAA